MKGMLGSSGMLIFSIDFLMRKTSFQIPDAIDIAGSKKYTTIAVVALINNFNRLLPNFSRPDSKKFPMSGINSV